MQRIYREAVDERVESLILSPNQLSRQDYVKAISGPEINSFMRGIAERVNTFKMDCALIVCGFDVADLPYIFSIGNEGVADMTTTGFHAIGSGFDKAIARLLFSEHTRDHRIERVIYDCFDAKANAEMEASVGYEWDAKLVFPLGLINSDVPEEIKDLLERAWAKFNRSPFEKFDPKKHWNLATDWKKQLFEYGHAEILRRIKEDSRTIPSTLQTSEGQQ